MNRENVSLAFLDRKESRTKNFFTNARELFSYGSHWTIAYWREDGATFALNLEKRSVTTSVQTTVFRTIAEKRGWRATGEIVTGEVIRSSHTKPSNGEVYTIDLPINPTGARFAVYARI
jgi:hypothetical protein